MKLLLDMSLSPTWVRFLEENAFVGELASRVRLLPIRRR